MAVRLVLVAGLVASACTLTPRPPPAPPRTTAIGLAITTSTLANGLRVVLVRDPTASEIQVSMRYEVGAVDDGPQAGLAHLVEHLMFQQELDGKALFAQLEDLTTYFNANTSLDATTYVARAPRARLDTLLAIEAARAELRCATISDAVFAREQAVVINEIKQRDQTSEVFAAIHRELYPEGHPYRQVIGGSVHSVAAIDRETACRFADVHYAPNNAVLVVSGNVTSDELDAALARRLARIPRRAVAPQPTVVSVPLRARQVEVPVPIDTDMFVLAWSLPLDPTLQAKVRALASAVPRLADAHIHGKVVTVEFGDRRAPMLGFAVMPGENESFADAVRGTRRALASLPTAFRTSEVDAVMFDRIKQSAIFELYASLDEGGDRDARLAAYVATGVDPNAALATELAALRSLTPSEAAQLAASWLAADHPTGITLRGAGFAHRFDLSDLRAPLHDLGTPAETTREVAEVRTHVLPNGLTIVLAPTSSVPTFEARLIFRTGSADEPADQRGVAMLAAHTLTWDLHFLNDLIPFVRAGASHDTEVTHDRTTFSVQGLDVHLDVVLAGLRRWVLEGTYDDSAAGFVRSMREASQRLDDEDLMTDAWRAALYGPSHPYVTAGIERHASNAITHRDAAAFRARNFVPGNATLVLAGRFDPELADRWIEYLFAAWLGPAQPRLAQPSLTTAASIARIDDVAMVQLQIALPTDHRPRAAQLVTAAMLASIARDVRFGLGASYTFEAELSEARLASTFLLGGWVDAARSVDAVRLIRDRLAELTHDRAVAARVFAVARTHVLSQLRSRVGSARSIADRIERDIELARAPMSDLATAQAVEALTLDDLTDSLTALDLTRATVAMTGPADVLAQSFAVLGRTPMYVALPDEPPDEPPGATAPRFEMAEQHVRLSEVRPSLTAQPPPVVAMSFSVGHNWAHIAGEPFTGTSFGAGLGYRGWSNLALGVRTEIATMAEMSFDVAGTAQLELSPRLWMTLLGGVHTDLRGNDLLLGAELGVDVLKSGDDRLGLAARWHQEVMVDAPYSSLSAALVFRR